MRETGSIIAVTASARRRFGTQVPRSTNFALGAIMPHRPIPPTSGLILLALALTLGCNQLSSMPEAPANATPVAAEPLAAVQSFQFNSGIGTRERLIVRSSEDWNALWPQLVGSLRPVPAVPPVDFSTKSVIVATMGTRSSGGYTIAVENVRVAGGDAWITVSEKAPGSRCGTTAALTAPIAVVTVPRFDGNATFLERAVTVDC